MINLNYLEDSVDFQKIERILVIKLQLLGDVLLTTPVYSVIKQQFPHIKIDVLIYKETAAVLVNNPDIHHIHHIDRNWKKQGLSSQIRHEVHLFKQLRNNKYNLIINLTDRWRGAGLTCLLKPDYAVSLAYTHRRGKQWRKIFTHIYAIPSHNHRHTVETHLDALRRLGLNLQSVDKTLTLKVNINSIQCIDKLLVTHQLQHKPFIVIHPTSRWMFKAWSPTAFAQLIDLLVERNMNIVLISGAQTDEIAYVDEILQASLTKKAINVAGQLSINECAGLIEKADCFIGLDSVAMHIAAAVNTMCVAIFGPTRDSTWHPWLVQHKVITEDFPCRPCGLKGCGNSMLSECIQAVQPKTVVEAVISLLDSREH